MTDTEQTALLQDDWNGATLSDDGTYRYRLWRTWDGTKPTLAWVMLNPSTADATADDPTIRRCINYAKRWGYGRIVVGNLFAYRATDPTELWNRTAIVGPENDQHLQAICDKAEMVVAAWGTYGAKMGRGPEVAAMLDADLYALGTTHGGHPWHPLRKLGDAEPEPFAYGEGGGSP